MPIFNIQGKPIKLAGVIPLYRDRDVSLVIDGINSSGVTLNLSQRMHIVAIIEGMKASGAWDKSKAFYGMIGGTAAAHKWNWKDMRDLDAAFRLQMFGTIFHDKNGFKGNGSTGYAETFLNASTELTLNSTHVSVFTNSNGGTNDTELSAIDSPNGISINLFVSFNGTAFSDQYNSFANNGRISSSVLSQLGLTVGSRTSASNHFLQKNEIKLVQSSFSSTTGLPNATFNISRLNNTQFALRYSSKGIGMVTIGDGLTESQAQQMSRILDFAQKMRANF